MNIPEGRLYTGSFNSSLGLGALRKAPPAVCEGSLQPSISPDPDFDAQDHSNIFQMPMALGTSVGSSAAAVIRGHFVIDVAFS